MAAFFYVQPARFRDTWSWSCRYPSAHPPFPSVQENWSWLQTCKIHESFWLKAVKLHPSHPHIQCFSGSDAGRWCFILHPAYKALIGSVVSPLGDTVVSEHDTRPVSESLDRVQPFRDLKQAVVRIPHLRARTFHHGQTCRRLLLPKCQKYKLQSWKVCFCNIESNSSLSKLLYITM